MLFSCSKANDLLQTDQDIKRRWKHAVRWLRDQFEVIQKFSFLIFFLIFFFS
jgi:hypothetical protein